MARFNTATATPPPNKGRVCLFVDQDLYRRLRSLLILQGSNPSRFFAEQAEAHLNKSAVGFVDAPPKRKRR